MGTKIGVVIAAFGLLVGCSNTTTGTGATDEDAGSSGNDGIYGSWGYAEPDGSGATAISLGENGTYSFVILKEESGGNEGQEETGTFTLVGSTIVWSPEKYTCTGSDPTYVTSYGLAGGNLSVTFGSTDIIFAPIAVSSTSSTGTPGLASGGEVTLGCFSTNGDFTAQALEPVGS